MGAIPPHIAITWQPKSVYEPGKRGVPSARPSTTISSDTCKPMTQPLSPDAQAVLDAYGAKRDEADPLGRWVEPAIAAALAALAEQQGEGPSDEEIISEAIRVGLVYRLDDELPDVFGSYREDHALNPHILTFACAVLSRWGHQPTPPAEGEVAELAAPEQP